MRIIPQKEIRLPSKALVIEPHEVAAHPITEILGAAQDLGAYFQKTLGETPRQLFPDGDSSNSVEQALLELQRNGLFDSFCCEVHAHLNGTAINHKAAFGTSLIPPSYRYTSLKCGVIPNVGTSDYAVEQSIINDGLVPESACVSNSDTMTSQQYFSKLDPALDLLEYFKKFYTVIYPPAPTYDGVSSNRITLYNISLYSVLLASVDGNYQFDSEGRICRSSQADSHKIIVLKLSNNGATFDLWLDSENPGGFVKADPNYDYHYVKFIYLKKKYTPMLYKLNGSPAIYCKHWSENLLIPFSDGSLAGGDVFKSLYGITDYSQLQINHVDTLPYPIATYSFITK